MIALLVFIFIFLIFRPWFSYLGTLSSGDWPYLFFEQIKEFRWLPEPRFLWLAPYYQIVTKIVVQYLGISWIIAERLLWFWPWIAISFFSSWSLTGSLVGALIYTTNTYALMLVGGGQMGVAMAYALAPFVIKRYTENKKLLLNGLLLAVQVMFDPRIALLTMVAAIAYRLIVLKDHLKEIIMLLIPMAVAIALNSFWIVSIIQHPNVVGMQVKEATEGAVQYLSFASFSGALSLTHPNWPENIFGKVYFLQPEFLLIPMLAFLSLLFLRASDSKEKRKILFYSCLALIGAFLAKGANGPFEFFYPVLFRFVPGFQAFRDPTKFYVFIALGYSVLIPFVLEKLKAVKWVTHRAVLIVFLLFWSFTLREAVMGKLSGTFQPVSVPADYVRFKDMLISQADFFQTGWFPEVSRFAFSDQVHPAVPLSTLDHAFLIKERIKYVVVPIDVRKEIFITDRMYDSTKYQEILIKAGTIQWLRRVVDYDELAVYTVR